MKTLFEGLIGFIGIAVICVTVGTLIVCAICKIEQYIKNRRNKK